MRPNKADRPTSKTLEGSGMGAENSATALLQEILVRFHAPPEELEVSPKMRLFTEAKLILATLVKRGVLFASTYRFVNPFWNVIL